MADEKGLFGTLPEAAKPSRPEAGRAGARLNRPVRTQVEVFVGDLDGMVAAHHMVRAVWAFVEAQDVSGLEEPIQARGSAPGRPAIDPAILLGLWLYATIDAVGSAREIARLCMSDIAYRWLCGKVGVNHHALSDFRVGHGAFLDRLLSRSVAALVGEGLVQLQELCVDGMRVRAHAGQTSFRRRDSLERLERQAAERVEALKRELEADAGAGAKRRQAAQARAAAERAERVAKAKARLRELEAERARRAKSHKAQGKAEPRASTTDADARVMKMADGGYRPAYNAQFVTDAESGVVVGVGLDATGSDRGLLRPAAEQVEERYGAPPARLLADGGFLHAGDVEWAQGREPRVEVSAPMTRSKHATDPYRPRPGDGPGMADLRARMREGEKQQKAKRAPAELPHARMRGHGLSQLKVRSAPKALCVFVWHALANNLLVLMGLRRRMEAAAA